MKLSARTLGPVSLALLASLVAAAGGACATAITVGAGGAGGDASSSSAGGAGGVADAGKDAPPPGSCFRDSDCGSVNDKCNVGTCVNGACVKGPANEQGPCDDGLFCTANDVCVSGVCTGGSPTYCAPPDDCHVGVCDEKKGMCVPQAGNDGLQCDDLDPCTSAGTCSSGQCTKGPPLDCSVLSSQCAVGVCMPGVGCVAQPLNDGQLCSDGKPPTGCSQGQCQMGTCMSLPKNDGQTCDDGLFCTINDHCLSANCVGDPNPCAAPNNTCQVGLCNENLKGCSVTVAPNGAACDDGNLCTSGETCSAGKCVGGQPANNGAACDDQNGCTAGTTCVNGACGNPQSQISTCVSGDSCCPAGCSQAQDSDCLYWASGVQQNVPNGALQGWTQCFTGNYSQSSPDLTTLLGQCSQAKLLTACRPVGSPTWTLLAMGPRADVLFDCASTVNCTKQSNGVGFYFSNSYSWGFAPGGESVNRTSCDFNGGILLPDQNLRMCWHTGGNSLNSGYRCGDNTLNGDATWERAVFQAN